MSQKNQFTLLTQRRFLPFFVTQFLGALNDNIYKNGLLLMVVFAAASALPFNSALFVNLAAGLFILPFFIFSGIAGQIADKYEKSLIVRRIKLLEIVIMLTASVFIISENYLMMLILLFLMGTQSAFFGPVKYSIIPQHLKNDELIGGNALVGMGTFVAILAGTLGAGLLLELDNAHYWIAGAVVTLAALGWFSSLAIPPAKAAAPDHKMNWNIFTQTAAIVLDSRENKAVFQSILAISWFWALGAAYLTQIPNLASVTLNGAPQVVSIMLAAFIVGVAGGSLICEKLSGKNIDIGIVPVGSIGLTIFGIDLFFAIKPIDSETVLTVTQFLSYGSNIRILFDLAMLGFFGGMFTVPLYALVQQRTADDHRARVIASLNVINSLFMVGSAVLGMLFLGVSGRSIPEFILFLSVTNLAVCLYIYKQVPEFALRFVVWILSHSSYRVSHKGLENIPETGPVLLACNHVSYVDALILGGAVRRPIRFIMEYDIYKYKAINWFFTGAKAIPICSPRQNKEIYDQSFELISKELEEGNIVLIFPEGQITKTGELNRFRPGIETILARNPVPVVPMALNGLWGSFFSHKDKPAFTKRPKRFWSKVSLEADKPWQPEDVTAAKLEQKIRDMI